MTIMKQLIIVTFIFLISASGCEYPQEKIPSNISLFLNFDNEFLHISTPSLISSKSSVEYSDYNNDTYLVSSNKFIVGNDTSECNLTISIELQGPLVQKSDSAQLYRLEDGLLHSLKYSKPINLKPSTIILNGFRVHIVKYNTGFLASGVRYDVKRPRTIFIDVKNLKNEKIIDEIVGSLQIIMKE